MTTILPTNFLKCAQADLGRAKIHVENLEELDRVLNINENVREYLQDEVADGIYDAEFKYFGLDTCVRDVVFDGVALYFTNRGWPIMADGEEVLKEFRETLIEGMKKNKLWSYGVED